MARLADAVVLRIPPGRGQGRAVVRLVPSWRWLAIAFGVLLAIGGGYLAARDSALFAVQRVEIDGAPPAVARDVRTALRPLEGESLLRVDLGATADRLAAIPSVRTARFDRAFPHTLLVTVAAERPVAVLRTGDEAWLVSARGRVIRQLAHPGRSSLPRVWAPATVSAAAGDGLGDAPSLDAVRALAAVADSHLPARVRYARSTDEGVSLMLMTGTELELGNDGDLALKLAVARNVLLALDPAREGWPAYMDLTLPGRPVVGFASSQVEGES